MTTPVVCPGGLVGGETGRPVRITAGQSWVRAHSGTVRSYLPTPWGPLSSETSEDRTGGRVGVETEAQRVQCPDAPHGATQRRRRQGRPVTVPADGRRGGVATGPPFEGLDWGVGNRTSGLVGPGVRDVLEGPVRPAGGRGV